LHDVERHRDHEGAAKIPIEELYKRDEPEQ
jgi:hypothetical protein